MLLIDTPISGMAVSLTPCAWSETTSTLAPCGVVISL